MKDQQYGWLKLTDSRAGCGKSARPVRIEGGRSGTVPTPMVSWTRNGVRHHNGHKRSEVLHSQSGRRQRRSNLRRASAKKFTPQRSGCARLGNNIQQVVHRPARSVNFHVMQTRCEVRVEPVGRETRRTVARCRQRLGDPRAVGPTTHIGKSTSRFGHRFPCASSSNY